MWKIKSFLWSKKRGLKIYMKAKHEITKVELTLFCKATEKCLSSDRDNYRKEIESEIEYLEDVIDMDMDSSKMLVNKNNF